MIQWKCVFCGVDFEFETCRHKGAHITNCKMNPKRSATENKLKAAGLANRVERVELMRECEKCGKEFTQTRTQAEIDRGGRFVNRCCSSVCSKSRDHSDETKAKTSATLKRNWRAANPDAPEVWVRNRPTKNWETRNCVICAVEFRCPPSSSKQACSRTCGNAIISQKLRGSGKVGGYKIKSGKSKFRGGYYCDVWMDSGWEIRFAKRLDDLEIEWDRDLTFFFPYPDQEGRMRKYYPDFYLPKHNLYVEIKGYWTDKVRFKMESVQKHNALTIRIVESEKAIDTFTI